MTEPTYTKRYRMERDLGDLPAVPELPPGYAWMPWRDELLIAHADAKFQSFRDEFDSCIFPSLASPDGCLSLMRGIAAKATFIPEATWLIAHVRGVVGTIQGLRDREFGAIQNVGVVPIHRGRNLGRILLLKALHGFRRAGLRRANLEVTAKNHPAMGLYRRLGFRSTRTIYKELVSQSDDALVVI